LFLQIDIGIGIGIEIELYFFGICKFKWLFCRPVNNNTWTLAPLNP